MPPTMDDNFDFDEIERGRHFITIDAVSLLETDAVFEFTEKAYDDIEFTQIIKKIRSGVGKFIFMCLRCGYDKKDIAYMLNIHPSTVTRLHQHISHMLRAYISQNQAIKMRK